MQSMTHSSLPLGRIPGEDQHHGGSSALEAVIGVESRMREDSSPIVVAKQVSEFQVEQLRFSPYAEEQLVSTTVNRFCCGLSRVS